MASSADMKEHERPEASRTARRKKLTLFLSGTISAGFTTPVLPGYILTSSVPRSAVRPAGGKVLSAARMQRHRTPASCHDAGRRPAARHHLHTFRTPSWKSHRKHRRLWPFLKNSPATSAAASAFPAGKARGRCSRFSPTHRFPPLRKKNSPCSPSSARS